MNLKQQYQTDYECNCNSLSDSSAGETASMKFSGLTLKPHSSQPSAVTPKEISVANINIYIYIYIYIYIRMRYLAICKTSVYSQTLVQVGAIFKSYINN